MTNKSKSLSFKDYPRGSGFYAYSNCTVSFQLSQASGEEPPTEFSDRGTDVHGGIRERKHDDPDIWDEAKALIDLRDDRVNRWSQGGKQTIVREKRLWIRQGLKPIYSGQPDEYVVEGRHVFLSDYKTGWHPQDAYAATNCQLRAYVPLIDADLKHEIDDITVAIHKPGAQSPPAIFDREAIDAAYHWAVSVAATATVEGTRKKPNRGPWCKYCAGKVLCPLWREEIMSISELSAAIASDIPDSMLRQIAPRLELAKQVTEKLLERLYDRVKAKPDLFSDWGFKEGQTKRKITDTIGAYNGLVAKSKVLSAGEFLACCSASITNIETLVKKHTGLNNLPLKDKVAELLGEALEIKQNKDQLVYEPKEALLEDELH